MNGIYLLCLLALAFSASAEESSLRAVGGVIDCGSAGSLLEIRVAECDQSPCHMVPGRDYDIAVDFIASADSTALNWKVWITLGPVGTPIADLPINGQITAGNAYTLTHSLPIHDTLSGLTVRVVFEIKDVATSRLEVCARAEAFIGV